MLGQLCPPSLLVVLSVLEAMFHQQHGIASVSLSLTQQTSPQQDLSALRALRTLAAEHLRGDGWHVVLYTYMGLFPRSPSGALRLLEDSVALAAAGGAERLVVKTVAEAHRIPTVAENVAALEAAARASRSPSLGGPDGLPGPEGDDPVLDEARRLLGATLELSPDVGTAVRRAFVRGLLDVPWCLHPDNAGRARSRVAADGWLRWTDVGGMPIDPPRRGSGRTLGSEELLRCLARVRHHYDHHDDALEPVP